MSPQIRRLTRLVSVLRAENPGPMTLEGTNSLLLRAPGSDGVVVVDPGPDLPEHVQALAAAGPVELPGLPEAVRARVAAFVAAGACHEDGDAAAAGQVVAGLNALLAFRGAAGPLVGRLDRAFEALRAALFRCLEAGPAGPADLASLQETQVLASVVQEMVGQDWREAALMCEDCLENTLGAPLDTYLLFWELRPAIDEALLQRFEGLPPPPAP